MPSHRVAFDGMQGCFNVGAGCTFACCTLLDRQTHTHTHWMSGWDSRVSGHRLLIVFCDARHCTRAGNRTHTPDGVWLPVITRTQLHTNACTRICRLVHSICVSTALLYMQACIVYVFGVMLALYINCIMLASGCTRAVMRIYHHQATKCAQRFVYVYLQMQKSMIHFVQWKKHHDDLCSGFLCLLCSV